MTLAIIFIKDIVKVLDFSFSKLRSMSANFTFDCYYLVLRNFIIIIVCYELLDCALRKSFGVVMIG